MSIIDVLDYLPDTWSENNKAKLVVWSLLLLLLLLIAGLMYAISDLTTTVNNQKNNLQFVGRMVDTLVVSDSTVNYNMQLLMSAWARRDSIDRLKDSIYFADKKDFDKRVAKSDERKRKWDKAHPEYAPSK